MERFVKKKRGAKVTKVSRDVYIFLFCLYIGEVNLRNLKLRRDALDKLDLPINVSEGKLLVLSYKDIRHITRD